MDATPASLDYEQQTICLHGAWINTQCEDLLQSYQKITWPTGETLTIDASNISQMDSVGAWLLLRILHFQQKRGIQVELTGLDAKHTLMFNIVKKKSDNSANLPAIKPRRLLNNIGKQTYFGWHETKQALHFLGEFSLNLLGGCLRLRKQQLKSFIYNIDATGYRALPIIGLLSFLIGVVLAYQMGIQLRNYGAEIYVVDLTGLAIFREFGPLITAIIVSGRTGSAFTAEIGTMKVNEELDALRTFGISPLRFVVLPKVLGLLVALPLLVVWADVFGILGSMVITKQLFSISYLDFINRFEHNVSLTQLYLGLLKTPFFALIISLVGCFQGLQVTGGAASVGKRTTKSVVIAIFLIIVTDAAFSIIFSWQGL